MIQIFNPSWLRIKVNFVTQFAPIMVWQREKIPFFFGLFYVIPQTQSVQGSEIANCFRNIQQFIMLKVKGVQVDAVADVCKETKDDTQWQQFHVLVA